jgi:hypothetical protein
VGIHLRSTGSRTATNTTWDTWDRGKKSGGVKNQRIMLLLPGTTSFRSKLLRSDINNNNTTVIIAFLTTTVIAFIIDTS